jgi:hypothetical protein
MISNRRETLLELFIKKVDYSQRKKLKYRSLYSYFYTFGYNKRKEFKSKFDNVWRLA